MLDRAQIEGLFEEINEELALRDIEGSILMAGSASLALIYDARESTNDIDALFAPKEAFYKIISDIGRGTISDRTG